MIHELKIHPQYYSRVADGSKTFEIRENDRGFQQGDTVILREWNPEAITSTDKDAPQGYTGSQPLEFNIGYVHVLNALTVVFALIPIKKPKPKN